MSARISRATTIDELGAIVCEALKEAGIEAVLTGGAVVTIYSKNEYQSYDLDFVVPGLAKNVDSTMKLLGFTKEKGRHWVHPKTKFFVEFPGSILAIGDNTDIETKELKTKAGTLRLLTPTSSLMDRLAAYYHWNDLQGLDQAVSIAKHQTVKLAEVRRWSIAEGMSEKFEKFLKALKHGST